MEFRLASSMADICHQGSYHKEQCQCILEDSVNRPPDEAPGSFGMPICPGENADLLRAIGRLIDSEGARELQLVNNEAFITVSWRSKSGGSDQRHFQDHNLEGLRRA